MNAPHAKAAASKGVERAIRRLERRVWLAIFVVDLARFGAGLLFFAGAAVLLLRAVWHLEAERCVPLFWIIALAPVIAAGRATARRLSRSGAAAWQDVRGGAEGMLVTALETGDERWSARVVEMLENTPPPPGIRMGGESWALGIGVVFALLAWWVHVPQPEPVLPSRLFEAAVERLAGKLLTLQEETDLDEELADEFATRLERLREQVGEASPEGLFEAIDWLEEQMGEQAGRHGEELGSLERQLVAAAKHALRDPAAAQETLGRALETMRALGLDEKLVESFGDFDSLASLIGEEGIELPEGLELDAPQLLEISKDLSGLFTDKLGALREAGLLTPELLAKLAEWKQLAEGDVAEHSCDENCPEGGT